MTYFSKFPLYITRSTGNEQIIITDFFRRVRVGSDFADAFSGLTPYIIADGETPESIANQYYGSPFYHWIVLLINNIVDVRLEWPLEYLAFETYVENKYDDPNGIHHYENAEGFVVDQADSIVPITNHEYETTINEAKRNIRLLDPDFLQQFIKNFDAKIGS